MKNKYEIVEVGTTIELKDEFGNVHTITVSKRTVIIYANGFHHNDWKIVIDEKNLAKVDEAVDGRWYVSVCKGTIYAKFCKQSGKTRQYILMHRVITDCPNDLVVDHDPHHYGLDNREENLTTKSAAENNRNQLKGKAKNLIYSR
jgi:hypothetical protein